MSKRHQASRRRTYGRRQHEVRERTIRHRDHDSYDVRVDTFGLQERFDDLCAELGRRWGLQTGEPLRTNTTAPTAVPPGFAERIAEDNALDMELYEYGCRLYEERHPS